VRTRSSPVKKMGVALAGGEPLGGIYEVGALLALADSLEEFDLNALDRITLRADRLADGSRGITDALADPRPLRSSTRRRTLRRTTRELSHTLDHLERLLTVAR